MTLFGGLGGVCQVASVLADEDDGKFVILSKRHKILTAISLLYYLFSAVIDGIYGSKISSVIQVAVGIVGFIIGYGGLNLRWHLALYFYSLWQCLIGLITTLAGLVLLYHVFYDIFEDQLGESHTIALAHTALLFLVSSFFFFSGYTAFRNARHVHKARKGRWSQLVGPEIPMTEKK